MSTETAIGAALAEPSDEEHLFEQIAGQLREKILTGEYAPGARISEREVAESFHVSRTPAREALRLLHREGAVRLFPNRGAQVPEYGKRMLLHTIEFVEYLEACAGELSCRRINEEEIRWIEFLTAEMSAAHAAADRLQYYNLNKRIHDAIVAAARNNVLAAEYKKYNARLYRVRFAPNQSIKGRNTAMREHAQMVRLLKARDGIALARLLRGHLSHAWRRSGFDPTRDDSSAADETTER